MDSANALRPTWSAILILGLAFGVLSDVANAAWPALGVRLCEVPGEQVSPIASSDGLGGAFVCWSDYRGVLVDGVFDADLYVQRVSADGQIAAGWPSGGFEIHSAPNDQWRLDLVPDGLGGCYVLWEDRSIGFGLYLTRLTADGQRSPGWPVPGLKIEDHLSCCSPAPNLIPDATGTYVVFDSDRGTTRHVYVQRVTGAGQIAPGWPSTGRRIGSLPTYQIEGRGVTDGAGGLAVFWEELRADVLTDIFAIRILPDGSTAPGWPENGIDVCTAPGRQVALRAVQDGAGGAFLVWTDYRSAPPGTTDDTQFSDVYTHHVLPNATVDTQWPANGLGVCVLPRLQAHRDVCADGQGGMFINWVDYRTSVSDIYVQRVRADGGLAPGWPINGKFAGGDPGFDSVLAPLAPDGSGGVYLAWQRDAFPRRTFTQHLIGNGQTAPGWQTTGNLLVDNGAESLDPWLVPDGYGGAVAAWADTRICGTCEKVFAQHVGSDGPTAVALSLVDASAEPGLAHLSWRLTGTTTASSFTLERAHAEGFFSAIAILRADGQGRLAYDDRLDEPGSYRYRLRYEEDRQARFSPLADLDVPSAFVLGLTGFAPNPAAVARPIVSFTLPRRASGSLALYDVSGRAVSRHDLSSLAAGHHTLGIGARMASGIYWIRLIHDGRQITVRGVIVQ